MNVNNDWKELVTKEFSLEDLLFGATCAVMEGSMTWRDVDHFCRQRQTWLRSRLQHPTNIVKALSHCEGVFQVFDAAALGPFLQTYMAMVMASGQISTRIAIERQEVRGLRYHDIRCLLAAKVMLVDDETLMFHGPTK